MKITVKLDTDMHYNGDPEVTRILHWLSFRLAPTHLPQQAAWNGGKIDLHDMNGKKVGEAIFGERVP